MPAPTSQAWLDALLALLFAFGGFESTFMAAGEMKQPRRDAPFALFVAIAVITAVYLSAHLVAAWSLPDLAGSQRPLADAARVFAGPIGAMVISLGAVMSTSGTLCANGIAAPRLVYALGERGDFPRAFAAVHPRFRTPHVAILVWAGLVLALALWGGFLWSAILSAAARLVTYAVSCAALIRLRHLQPAADAWRAPAGPLLACIGIGFCGVLVFGITGDQAMVMGAIFLLAAVNWFAARKSARSAAA
jgi:amino acid transporter